MFFQNIIRSHVYPKCCQKRYIIEPEKLIYYCEFRVLLYLSGEICFIEIILISYSKTIIFLYQITVVQIMCQHLQLRYMIQARFHVSMCISVHLPSVHLP